MGVKQDWTCVGANNVKANFGSQHQKKNYHGVCMALSNQWVKKTLNLGRKLNNRSELGDEMALRGVEVAYVAHDRTHSAWEKDNMDKSFEERVQHWHDTFAEANGLALERTAKGSYRNDLLANGSKDKGSYILSFYGTIITLGGATNVGSSGGHTVAFINSGATKQAFFDPNAGQYSYDFDLSSSVFSGFASDIETWLKNAYKNIFGTLFIYKVSLA